MMEAYWNIGKSIIEQQDGAERLGNFSVSGRICRCAYAVDWDVICFLLPW